MYLRNGLVPSLIVPFGDGELATNVSTLVSAEVLVELVVDMALMSSVLSPECSESFLFLFLGERKKFLKEKVVFFL